MSGTIVNGLTTLTQLFNGSADPARYDFSINLNANNPNDATERLVYMGDNDGSQQKPDITGGVKEVDLEDVENVNVFSIEQTQSYESFRDALAFRAVSLMHESLGRGPPTRVNGEDLEEIRGNLDKASARIASENFIGLDTQTEISFIHDDIRELKSVIDAFIGPHGEENYEAYVRNMIEAVNQSDDLSREQKQEIYNNYADLLSNPNNDVKDPDIGVQPAPGH